MTSWPDTMRQWARLPFNLGRPVVEQAASAWWRPRHIQPAQRLRQPLHPPWRLPRDPLAPSDTEAPARTWGLRSYASPPNDPKPGADVFDVHSKAEGVGLDGRPYRQW